MHRIDLKYLLVWLVPIFGFAGFYFQSWMSPGSFFLAFIGIPILESFLPVAHFNFKENDKVTRAQSKLFDVLLYLNLPILYALLCYFVYNLTTQSIHVSTWIFLILNMGILIGVIGINVAHELGHRKPWFDQLIAQLLLAPALYMHFTLEHNYWHHKYVSTPDDPSSARKNETVYVFWIRSIFGVLKNAFKLENRRLKSKGFHFFHWSNKFFIQILIQSTYLILVLYFAGITPLISVIFAAFIGILLLETINYIEHYGLVRHKQINGLYQIPDNSHSWNSDHTLGRIFLYELTRHAHHHEKADVKYQNLDSLKRSPQLPYGYPACLLISLIPPFWFKLMNPRITSTK